MNKQQIKLFSSRKSDEYGTPKDRFDKWNEEFKFHLDVCATEANHKCEFYYNINDNALTHKWWGRCFCNPPYSKIRQFLAKGSIEIKESHCRLIVFLTFANTDTKWFWDYVYDESTNKPRPNVEVRFIKGRLSFTGNETKANAAMRPSMLIIMKKE